MATNPSILAWRIPGTEEPGGLPSMGSHCIRHDLNNLAATAAAAFLPGEFHGQRSQVGYSPQGSKHTDMTEATQHTHRGAIIFHTVAPSSGSSCQQFLIAPRGKCFQQRQHLGRQQLWTELTPYGTAGDVCPCSCTHHSFSLWLASKWWRPAAICYFTPHNSYSGAQDHPHKARQAGFLLSPLLVLIDTKLAFSNEALRRLLLKVSFSLQSG